MASERLMSDRAAKDKPVHDDGKDKVNILVVDDHPDKLLVFETILEELNENVVTVRSGKDALKAMLEQEFAVILLDVKMPEMDGFETAALIRARKKFSHTPIIFVTAYEDEMHTAEGYSLGAVDYILTPIVPEVLRTKVGVFVQLYRMANQIRRQAEERITLVREQAARAAAEDAIRRSNFLAEASQVLSRSLDVTSTITNLTRFAVPYLGNLCALAQVDERGAVCATHLAWSAGRADATTQQASVARITDEKINEALTGSLARSEPELIEFANDQITIAANGKDGSVTLLPLGFALRKLAIYPLLARGRQLGALLIGSSASHHFNSAELALASDLAGRTAIALDNAMLYSKIHDADQRKDEFLAMLAHELRNPLAPIRSAVAMMRRIGNQAPLLDWSRDIIDRQVEHLIRLVDDLLDVSRLNEGKIRLAREPVVLSAVIERAIEVSRPSIDSHKHQLEVAVPSDPIHVDGDPVRLAQVFANLLNNAAKYTPEGGNIRVAVAREGRKVTVRVLDNGCGIAPEVLPHVFDLFTQANRSLARSEGGLGIGLTLVRNLLQLHGGAVEARSEGLGKGSEFIVQLPVLEGVTAAPAPVDKKPVMPPLRSAHLRILLVDDNVDSNDTMAALLRLYGQDIRTALDGPTALQIAPDFKPQLVLCDIGLPGMDGYEVMRRLREQCKEVQPVIVAVTGYTQTEARKRSDDIAFDYHFVKPIDPEALHALVDEQLKKNDGAGATQ
jgi:signal transduction histidine kinase/DNA-binding response OmpR family regulator